MGASALHLVPHRYRRVAQRVGQAASGSGIAVYPIAGVARDICAGYGQRPKPDGTFSLHDACDLCAPTGSAAVAVNDGVVSYGTDGFGGNVAILRTADGTGYYYAHLLNVQSGQRAVRVGEQIGVVDTTGNAALVGIPHVHFQIWPGGQFDQGTVHPDPTDDLMAAPILDEPVGSWLRTAAVALGGLAAGAAAAVAGFWLADRHEVG